MFHPQGPTFFELARQALSSTERGYDLLASKFEFTPFRTPDSVLNTAASHFGGPESLDAGLDICCGTGAAMRLLRPICRERVVGVDFSQGMLAEGRRLLSQAPGRARLEFVRANALEMPFRAEFDLAVCFGALGHILPQDQSVFLRQLWRSLKPGGRFVFVTSSLRTLPAVSRVLARTFNGAMRVRNLLYSPPFIMYYLTFLLPQAKPLLESHGFQVRVTDGLFESPYAALCLVVATRP